MPEKSRKVDKQKLLEVLQKYDVKELWVNFHNPFEYRRSPKRSGISDVVLVKLCKDDEFSQVSFEVQALFDQDWNSDEEDVIMAINLMAFRINDSDDINSFTRDNRKCYLLYTKEGGFLG